MGGEPMSPLTLDKFDAFFRLLPDQAERERSWSAPRKRDRGQELRFKGREPPRQDRRRHPTPEELLDLIEAKGREVAEALALMRSLPPGR